MTELTYVSPELSLLLTALVILVLDITLSDRIKRFIPIVAIVGVVIGLTLVVTQWGTEVILFRVLVHDSITVFTHILIFITMIIYNKTLRCEMT